MIVRVAVKTGTAISVADFHAASGVYVMIQQFDIVVGDYNCIIDKNSERHNQARDRDLM